MFVLTDGDVLDEYASSSKQVWRRRAMQALHDLFISGKTLPGARQFTR